MKEEMILMEEDRCGLCKYWNGDASRVSFAACALSDEKYLAQIMKSSNSCCNEFKNKYVSV